MSKQQIEEIQDLVEGLVAGRMLEAAQSKEKVKRVSHNAGAYVAGQLREMVV